MKKIISIFLLLLITLSSGVHADLQEGLDAYQSGNYSLALKHLEKAAEQGDASVQFLLGVMYVNGEGVRQDQKAAVKWYRKASEQGNDSAQFNLGNMYAEGRGVRQDDKAAVKWYRKAAWQGLAVAQLNLGLMYADGRGVRPMGAKFGWI